MIFWLKVKERLMERSLFISLSLAAIVVSTVVVLTNDDVDNYSLIVPASIAALACISLFQGSIAGFIARAIALLVTTLMVAQISRVTFGLDPTGRVTIIWACLSLFVVFAVLAVNSLLKNSLEVFALILGGEIALAALMVVLVPATATFTPSFGAAITVSLYAAAAIVVAGVWAMCYTSRNSFKIEFLSKKVFRGNFVSFTKTKGQLSDKKMKKMVKEAGAETVADFDPFRHEKEFDHKALEAIEKAGADTGLGVQKFKASGKVNALMFFEEMNFVAMPTNLSPFVEKRGGRIPSVGGRKFRSVMYSYINSFSARHALSGLPVFYMLVVDKDTIGGGKHATTYPLKREGITLIIVERAWLSNFINDVFSGKSDITIVSSGNAQRAEDLRAKFITKVIGEKSAENDTSAPVEEVSTSNASNSPEKSDNPSESPLDGSVDDASTGHDGLAVSGAQIDMDNAPRGKRQRGSQH